jgi:two-component system, response regulator, stage 0 sporulation protein F
MDEMIKLLYVDDEPINLMLFEAAFSKKYDVITVDSGFKGLEVLKDNQDICVVISDMNMPSMNGIEFISQAKADYPDICFYILTGYEITSEIQESLSNGLILKYFQKPFKMPEIHNTIEENLAKK